MDAHESRGAGLKRRRAGRKTQSLCRRRQRSHGPWDWLRWHRILATAQFWQVFIVSVSILKEMRGISDNLEGRRELVGIRSDVTWTPGNNLTATRRIRR